MNKKMQRTNKLIQILKEKNGASVKELSQILEVSEMTIRRDLEVLKDNNIVTNVYGATIYNPTNNINKLSSYDLDTETIKFEDKISEKTRKYLSLGFLKRVNLSIDIIICSFDNFLYFTQNFPKIIST